MEYILIPASSESEKIFLLQLFKKMKIKPAALSIEAMENYSFLNAMKESESSGKGYLNKIKSHLKKVAAEK